MNILYIDIASHKAHIACCSEDAVVSSYTEETRVGDAELIPLIEEQLKAAGWEYGDLTHIACVVGPGGFTSLRVACACANTLADQLGIPAAPVHLSDIFAARIPGEGVLWMHSTKKDSLFVRSLGEGPWSEPTFIGLEDCLASLPADVQWCGDLIEEHQIVVGGKEMIVSESSDWLPEFLAGLSYSKKLLLPWYGREG